MFQQVQLELIKHSITLGTLGYLRNDEGSKVHHWELNPGLKSAHMCFSNCTKAAFEKVNTNRNMYQPNCMWFSVLADAIWHCSHHFFFIHTDYGLLAYGRWAYKANNSYCPKAPASSNHFYSGSLLHSQASLPASWASLQVFRVLDAARSRLNQFNPSPWTWIFYGQLALQTAN